MKIQPLFNALLKNPRLITSSKNIFLVSHMRGNTSLLSHLLGSHPEIEGYYEMHMGYYSWKSLYRQKLLYLRDHDVKASSIYFFDKVLHNTHKISEKILKSNQSKIIIMLREPEQTIRSIVSLYSKVEPEHEWCNPDNAARYYIERLEYIRLMIETIPNAYFYIDSDSLRDTPEVVLRKLSSWLKLNTPIPLEYSNFKYTGKEKHGDSSKNIRAGKILKKANDYSFININEDLLNIALNIYATLTTKCIGYSDT